MEDEIKVEVRVIKVKKKCPRCSDGKMVAEGGTLLSNPPQYWSKCDLCGHRETYRKSYPYIKYEEIN